jgi:hypothetical protein
LIPITLIKGAILFREGEPNDYLYFLKNGEIEIRKKVAFPKLGVDTEDVAKILFDPQQGRTTIKKDAMLENRQHVVGLVGKGHILGIEEAVLG